MFLPLLFACSCCWSLEDFRQEVDAKVYELTEQSKSYKELNCELWYVLGQLSVYKQFQYNLNHNDNINVDYD